jgi:hypothetical protein
MRFTEEKKCFHKRIKRNYPHGKKSKPIMHCKDCGKSVTKLELKDTKRSMKRKR